MIRMHQDVNKDIEKTSFGHTFAHGGRWFTIHDDVSTIEYNHTPQAPSKLLVTTRHFNSTNPDRNQYCLHLSWWLPHDVTANLHDIKLRPSFSHPQMVVRHTKSH